MNRFFAIIATVVSAALFAQESASSLETGPEKEWGMSLALQYAGHYFDKGNYSNTDPVLQGDVEFTWKELFIGATGIYDLTDQNGHDRTFEEYDYIGGWRPSLGGDWDFFIKGLDFQIAYIHYVYPRSREDDSNEINIAVNAQCLLSPGVDLYWDFENDIAYGNFNVAHGIELAKKLTWNLEAQLWWGNRRFQERDFDVSRNSLVSVVAKTSLDYAVTDFLTIGPFVQCGRALGRQMRDSWKADKDQSAFNANYGVVLSMEF
ncbi:MAG: hypothetical protein MJ202_02305 [Lentisphaeria bacterium]|nr:hypothetical protein [Lentisphaeria bacterium]